MESVIAGVLAFIFSNSGASSFILGMGMLFAGIYFYFKKTKIEEYTSAGTVQHQQIESLMNQVRLLSEELAKARTQLSEIHSQNIKLMVQIRESNLRIQELEDIIHSKS